MDALTSRHAGARGAQPTRGTTPGGLLGNAAVLIWNDVVPEAHDEFYAWHDKEHIPERLLLPGFRRGRRYRRSGRSPEWLTMYEAVDVSALVSPEYLARLNAPSAATQSALKHFRNTSRAVCRLDTSLGTGMGGHMLALRLAVDAQRADAMRRYLRDEAFPSALGQTGVLACHLYAADTAASYVSTAESSTRAFDVPAWVLLCEASNAGAAGAVQDGLDGSELARLGVQVRDDGGVYALEICRLS